MATLTKKDLSIIADALDDLLVKVREGGAPTPDETVESLDKLKKKIDRMSCCTPELLIPLYGWRDIEAMDSIMSYTIDDDLDRLSDNRDDDEFFNNLVQEIRLATRVHDECIKYQSNKEDK